MPRSSPGSVLFSTYNMLDLFESGGAAGRRHYQLVTEVIRRLDADVLAVQEIRAATAAQARARLRRLAGDVGMDCVAAGRTALAVGSRGYHCGLLWRPGLEAVPGSFRESGPGRLWHSAGWLTFRLGGRVVRHGVFHATPFGRELRAMQNQALVSMLSAGPDAGVPLLIGADWNAQSADEVTDPQTGQRRLYEAADPFAAVSWDEDLVHQCCCADSADGIRRHWVDRSAGEALVVGGLVDAAAALGARWQATCGYFPGDGYGSRGILRRIDGIRVTAPVLPALRSHEVTDTPAARLASDHLPVTVEYEPADVAG
jgi:hypothetical protein